MNASIYRFVIFSALIWASAVNAELVGLAEWLGRPDDSREPSYIHVRCAALYQGLFSYVGKERLGDAIAKSYDQFVIMNSYQAVLIRQSRIPGASVDELIEGVKKDRAALSITYNERMHRNYQDSGEAMVSDPLFVADLTICKKITEALAK